MLSTLTPPAPEALARREFAALRGTPRDPGIDRELPPCEFDATFPPIAALGWDAGWERVPASFVGPVELTLLGVRLRWVRVRPRRRTEPQYEFVQARGPYGLAIDDGVLVQVVDLDEQRFRHF